MIDRTNCPACDEAWRSIRWGFGPGMIPHGSMVIATCAEHAPDMRNFGLHGLENVTLGEAYARGWWKRNGRNL